MMILVTGIVIGVIFTLMFNTDKSDEHSEITENRQWQNLMEYDGTLRGQEYED